MFTSRAEYRLLLRQDNADLRLMDHAKRLGLVDDTRYAKFQQYRASIDREVDRLKNTFVRPSELPPDLAEEYNLHDLQKSVRVSQLLARPEISYSDLVKLGLAPDTLNGQPSDCDSHTSYRSYTTYMSHDDVFTNSPDAQSTRANSEFGIPAALAREAFRNSELQLSRIAEQVELAIKYEGYIARQHEQVARAARLEDTRLPLTLDYTNVRGLRAEATQKLTAARPETLGQASRIAGVNPADISVLMVHLKAREAA
jgi:tRNA uridine 5-carboxymethylaminomethyl modification enzyme